MHAPTRTLHRRSGSAGGATPREGSRPSASLCLPGFRTHRLARMSDSLVRVSRRVGWGARWPMPRSRVYPAGHADGARRFLDRVDGSEPDGALTLPGAPFQGTWARSRVAPPDLGSRSVASTRATAWVLEASSGQGRRPRRRLAQRHPPASCSITNGPALRPTAPSDTGGHPRVRPDGTQTKRRNRGLEAACPWRMASGNLRSKTSMVRGISAIHRYRIS
ncbi:unnamed protein product, partial [Musa textilis]